MLTDLSLTQISTAQINDELKERIDSKNNFKVRSLNPLVKQYLKFVT